MRGVTYSKLVFLDSQDGVRGAKALRPTFTVPSNDFSVGNEESIRLTLKSFSMPVQYYGINQSNDTFHYRNTTTNTNTEISIPRGDYTPTTLASNVAAAVNSVFSSGTQFTCNYDEATRKFNMSIPTGYASGYFTSFFDKNQTHAHSKANQSTYSDAHEVLGGRSSLVSNPVNMFDGDAHVLNGGATTVTSKYPIRTSTLDAIYLRSSVQSDAFCSTSFDPSKSGNKLESTDIWAQLPATPDGNNLISYQDNADSFQIHVKPSQLSTLKFSVSDGKGRELPLLSDHQAEDGNARFRIAFKFEVMKEDHLPRYPGQPVEQYTHAKPLVR